MQVFIGTVLLSGFSFAPVGWALCDGRLLPIAEYSALFNLLGTAYGGDGQTTFALPDLRGRVPVCSGQLLEGTTYVTGQTGGVENVSISLQQYPRHTHALMASTANAATGAPSNAVLAAGQQIYASGGNPSLTFSSNACGLSAGQNQPHENLQPFLAMNWIIALEGIYPSQS